MDASFRISGTVMIWVNISILWDNVHGEEYLIEEINENLPSYLQIKIWVFPNHSIFGKSHTPPRKYVCRRVGHGVYSQNFCWMWCGVWENF